MEIYKLNVKQVRKVEELIKAEKASHLEIEKGHPTAKVFQEDGQMIGEITSKQVYLVKFFWS